MTRYYHATLAPTYYIYLILILLLIEAYLSLRVVSNNTKVNTFAPTAIYV
jgi:hypothetical protein